MQLITALSVPSRRQEYHLVQKEHAPDEPVVAKVIELLPAVENGLKRVESFVLQPCIKPLIEVLDVIPGASACKRTVIGDANVGPQDSSTLATKRISFRGE